MQSDEIKKLLATDMLPVWQKIESRRLDSLVKEFFAWFNRSGRADEESVDSWKETLSFLLFYIDEKVQHISRIRLHHAEFTRGISNIITEDEKRKYILNYADDLGATKSRLKGDRRAFKRWFGHDAVTDRYTRALKGTERDIALALEILGVVTARFIESNGPAVGYRQLWRQFNIERSIKPLLAYTGDGRVRIAAFQCLAAILWSMPDEFQEGIIEENILQYVYRSALDSKQDVWIQREALVLLESISSSSLIKAIKSRLSRPVGGDDLFVRQMAVVILGKNIRRLPELSELIPVAAEDPSVYVRQALSRALIEAPAEHVRKWLLHLSLNDKVPQVRAASLLQIEHFLNNRELFEDMLNIMCEALENEKDEFVLRTALMCAFSTTSVIIEKGDDNLPERWYKAVISKIVKLHSDADSLSVRRWAAQAREKIWAEYDEEARSIKERVLKELNGLKPGKKRTLSPALLSSCSIEKIARVLAVLNLEDYSCQINQGLTGTHVIRGDIFYFRLWRLLYELRTPSPDKRQAFSHTVGRIFTGNIHVPSAIMSELTETKVPGEPLFMPSESGWRPYLPLVDEVISSLRFSILSNSIQIFTSEGITMITPPESALRRLVAYAKLTWRFSYYSRLRNWNEGSQSSPSSYIKALSDLGFKIGHADYVSPGEQPSSDPSVKRFFFPVAAFIDPNTWAGMKDYFFSVYENSLYELGIFTGIIIIAFVLSILLQSQAIRNTRKQFPLVLGGWGTRGKSGTERLKAGLINALGYSLVSKTTGCEAMFLYSRHYEKTEEMFLFRPYDKATIWEQFNLMRIAEGLKTDIFLWECMGLTPSYVKILQRKWGRDDISTITNTYPDHEDLQGPAGINIPQVMTDFIPESGTLLCSEEQMKPILSQAAKELGSRTKYVGWLEAGMIPDELLERFPYEEHPYNIALVLALAEELGIDRDFAIREMADRVIPDIGVLMAFPAATVKSRRLEFVNGMSANERYGFLSNWERMDFKGHDHEAEPGVWITTVVNNRADRITRSRIFAKILVEDISADKHFLIGSNLKGLAGYIKEAWNDFVSRTTLWPETGDSPGSDPSGILKKTAYNLRVPTDKEHIINRLRAMLSGINTDLDPEALSGLWNEPERLKERLDEEKLGQYRDDIIRHLNEYVSQYKEYIAFSERLSSEGSRRSEELDIAFHKMIWRWFESKLVIIQDFHASGDKIIKIIQQATPPGIYNRIMGIQNIKGTGLDFVYRWQTWEKCFKACRQIHSNDLIVFDRGLSELSVFQEYGILCEEHVRKTVTMAKSSPLSQNEKAQAELAVTLSNLENAMTWVYSRIEVQQKGGILIKIVEAIEAFLDVGDAVKRRKIANRIYKDMVTERISHERAAMELKALNKRQKGGWLWTQFSELRSLIVSKAASSKTKSKADGEASGTG